MTKNKSIRQIDLIISGVLFIGLGLFVLANQTLFLLALSYVFGLVYVYSGIMKLIRMFFPSMKQKNVQVSLSQAIFHFVLGIILILFPNMPANVFAFLFGGYMFAYGITYGIHYMIQRKNKIKGRISSFMLCIFYLLFSAFLGLTPYMHISLIMNVLAVYFILYGCMFFKDLIPVHQKDTLKRRIRISLPVFMQALIPKVVLDEVNQFLSVSGEDEEDAHNDLVHYHSEEKADVEVFIHASNKGFGKVGHVDICINDIFYSYGNYDYHSVRLKESVGDGVLIACGKENYIPFVIEDGEKTLFCYGLKLSDKQKQRVIEQMEKIYKNMYVWKPPKYQGKDDMYASRMQHACWDACFYKFKKGRFKTYFVATTNCVKLADYVVGSTGLDVLKMNGIITPGAYYEYLDRQFLLHSEMVIYKKIYN